MADNARNSRPDLARAETEIEQMDFFRMLALLEGNGKRFGRSGGPENEPARLGQSPRMAFAAQDVASISRPSEVKPVPHIGVNVLGLLGPEGPMPLHMTRWVMERLSNRWFAGDDAASFLNLFFIINRLTKSKCAGNQTRGTNFGSTQIEIIFRESR